MSLAKTRRGDALEPLEVHLQASSYEQCVKSHPTATPFSRPKMTPYRCAGCRY